MKPLEWIGTSLEAVRGFHEEARKNIVLHAFQKKSRKIPKPDLELASLRFKELLKQRKAKHK